MTNPSGCFYLLQWNLQLYPSTFNSFRQNVYVFKQLQSILVHIARSKQNYPYSYFHDVILKLRIWRALCLLHVFTNLFCFCNRSAAYFLRFFYTLWLVRTLQTVIFFQIIASVAFRFTLKFKLARQKLIKMTSFPCHRLVEELQLWYECFMYSIFGTYFLSYIINFCLINYYSVKANPRRVAFKVYMQRVLWLKVLFKVLKLSSNKATKKN